MPKTIRWILGLGGMFILVMLYVIVKELHITGIGRMVIVGVIFSGIYSFYGWINGGKK